MRQSKILWDGNGNPAMAFGKNYYAVTKGASSSSLNDIILSPESTILNPYCTEVGDYLVVNWGENNDFPTVANALISKTGVLNAALLFLNNVAIGQGVYPVTVEGYDDDGTEVTKPVADPKIRKFLKSRIATNYMCDTMRDILKYGRAYPLMIPTADGKSIHGIANVKAWKARLTQATNGRIENVISSARWPIIPRDNEWTVYPMLDDYDPEQDIKDKILLGQFGKSGWIYPLYNRWSDNEYYPLPNWWTAKLSGWIDIANKVPKFIASALENQITIKWHIQIPYAYWEKRYPKSSFKTEDERRQAIEDEMDSIEENLTGDKGANKAIFSMFEVGINGKAEEQWEIKPLDSKLTKEQDLFTSAAANSEILFSVLLNPNVLGAGMPGGIYSGSSGGSNIREAYLVNVANSWIDQQRIYDPLEAYIRTNGGDDVELRTKKMILTTLDTGKGATSFQQA